MRYILFTFFLFLIEFINGQTLNLRDILNLDRSSFSKSDSVLNAKGFKIIWNNINQFKGYIKVDNSSEHLSILNLLTVIQLNIILTKVIGLIK